MLLTGVLFVALGATLASQGVDAYEALRQSAYTWQEVLAAVGGFGALGMVAAGIAVMVWLFQAIENLGVLPAPDVRPRSESLVFAFFVLFPALAVAYFVVRSIYPNASAFHFALYVAATASLVGPFVVIRRLWVSSGARSTSGTAPPVWSCVLVWWVALEVAWMTLGFAPAVMAESWDYYRFVDEVTQLYAAGLLQVVTTTALVVAAALIVRIMFRVNEMQEVLAHRVVRPTSPSDRLGVGPARRAAVQWRCDSCDFLNHPIARRCQNCAQENR